MTRTKAFRITGLVAILIVLGLLVVALFQPPLEYKVVEPPEYALESEEYLRTLEAICHSRVNRDTLVEVLNGGEQFYGAALEEIRAAERSITLEAFIFDTGEVTRRLVDAMAERARAGVKVSVVVDSVGSLYTPKEYFEALTDAGGDVRYYHPVRWYTLPSYNNRTHRELIVVDGRRALVGGAGFADQWLVAKDGQPPWRDTMVRVQGEAVNKLQGVFAENWLEASGILLTSSDYFRVEEAPTGVPSLVVGSTPGSGRSTRARMLYQTLIASARRQILIQTPYFIPDTGLTHELVEAARRGVEVRVIAPGEAIDHQLPRYTSRALYGELLPHGIRIFEYQPTMMHVKSLVVDGLWVVVGSTNLDNRSFGLNDELNLAVRDRLLAAQLTQIFEEDQARSREMTMRDFENRSWLERVRGRFGLLLERQQ